MQHPSKLAVGHLEEDISKSKTKLIGWPRPATRWHQSSAGLTKTHQSLGNRWDHALLATECTDGIALGIESECRYGAEGDGEEG